MGTFYFGSFFHFNVLGSDTNIVAVFKKFLKHSNTYQIGRSAKGHTSSTFVTFSELYISKEHLQIEIKPPNVDLVEYEEAKSLLFVKIQSRAMTRINGQKFKLQKNQEPFTVEFTEQQKLDISFKDENAIEINLEWCNFFITTQGILKEDRNIAETLLKYYETGLDIRVTNNPFKATHLLYSSDEITYNLVVALLRAIPVISSSWLHDVKDSDWQVNTSSPGQLYNFLPDPKNTHENLLPNTKRCVLLSEALVLLCNNERNEINRLVESLGGRTVSLNKTILGEAITEPSNLMALVKEELRISEREKCYLFVIEDESSKELFLQIPKIFGMINERRDLYNSILDGSTSLLKPFDVEINFDPPFSQEKPSFSPRKRRKFGKVGKIDFFNFEKVPESLPQPDATSASAPAEKLELEIKKDDLGSIGGKEKQQVPESKASKRGLPNKESEGSEPQNKKFRLLDHENETLRQVSLSDALKSTKQKAVDFASEDLGLTPTDNKIDDLKDGLEDLAVVETVNIFRKERLDDFKTPKESYGNRTNYKKFRKNKPLRNQNRIEMHIFSSQENDVDEDELFLDDVTHIEQQCQHDFKDSMPEISSQQTLLHVQDHGKQEDDFESFSFSRTQKREPEQSLFVPESQNSQVLSEPSSLEKIKKMDSRPSVSSRKAREQFKAPRLHQESSESDDDDDDDDLPKFTFRRR